LIGVVLYFVVSPQSNYLVEESLPEASTLLVATSNLQETSASKSRKLEQPDDTIFNGTVQFLLYCPPPQPWQEASAIQTLARYASVNATCEFSNGFYRLSTLAISLGAGEGSLPDYLWEATGLQKLSIVGRSINGSLSSNIRFLGNLTNLTIIDTMISGEIPSEIGSLTQLKVLVIETTKINGTIPQELGQLKKLNVLYD